MNILKFPVVLFFFFSRSESWVESMNTANAWRNFQNDIPRLQREKLCPQKLSTLLHIWNVLLTESPSSAFLFEGPFLGDPKSCKNSLWVETWQIKSWGGRISWKSYLFLNDRHALQIFIILYVPISVFK